MPGPDVAELERSIQEALCCPDGCLRRDSDCWIRLGRYGAKKSVPVIMQIIARTLASQSQERDAEIKRAEAEECAKVADRTAKHYEDWAAKYPDEYQRCGLRIHTAESIAANLRARAQQPTDGEVKT